jgi:hypothetical protein
MSAKETERKGSAGAGAFVSDVKEPRRPCFCTTRSDLTTLGGNGLHRPQGFPEWLPLTCWDVLTGWPTGTRAARWTPSQGRRSVDIWDPSSMDIINAN